MCTNLRPPVVLASAAIFALIAIYFVLHGPQDAVEGAGSFDVGDNAVAIDIEQKGPCQPGALESGYSINATDDPSGANPILLRFTSPLNDNPGFRGCIAPRCQEPPPPPGEPCEGPQLLVIGNELFKYANLHTRTADNMHVADSGVGFNLLVDSCFGFSPSDYIYVGLERMQWDTGVCDGAGGVQDYLHITSRPDSVDYQHWPNAFVRVHGLLYLMERGNLPTFLDYSTSTTPLGIRLPPTAEAFAYTAATTHAPGALAHSPSTFARCRDRLFQTPQAGDDTVTARTRCALIYEPGYSPTGCDSDPDDCYWPVSPPLDTAVLRRPVFPLKPYYDLANQAKPAKYDELGGFIDDDGVGGLTFNDLPLGPATNCKMLFQLSEAELLYVGHEMSIPTGTKNFNTGSNGSGTFITRYFVVTPPFPAEPCFTGAEMSFSSPVSFLGLASDGLPTDHDTDGDGCPDLRELGGATLTGGALTGQSQGGWRDPLNRYDYLNPTGDGLNRVDDILAVVNQYFIDDPVGNPDLTSTTDRTSLKPEDWNLGKPNGQQRVDDILAAVKQYFHDC